MNEQFERYVEELKLENADSERTKKYILVIKSKLDELIQNCEGELTKQECLDEFIEAYREDLKYDKDILIGKIYPFLIQYTSYKEIINLSRSNKLKLRKAIEEAKKREKTSKGEIIRISLDSEEQIIRSLMGILRENPEYKEKDILARLQIWKSSIQNNLKTMLIKSIQSNVAFLDEYGILDSYISEANDNFELLGLNELKLVKRNPIPDEYGDGHGNFIRYDEEKKCYVKYDENGRIVKDGEDLTKYDEDPGVVDMFDEKYLKRLSPEDLLMLDLFWRGKYLQERIEIAKAMSTIRDLNLWGTILNNDKSKITEINNSVILKSIKTYYAQKYEFDNPKKEIEETPKKSIFKRKSSKKTFDNEEQNKKSIVDSKELEILSCTLRDLVSEECILISKLKAKDFSIRGWGTLDNDVVETFADETVFVIDNASFRGPVIMSVPTEELKRFFGIDDIKFPKYKWVEKIDFVTSKTMEKLYLPASNFFNRQALEKQKENPSSKVLALYTGKKVKENPNTRNDNAR